MPLCRLQLLKLQPDECQRTFVSASVRQPRPPGWLSVDSYEYHQAVAHTRAPVVVRNETMTPTDASLHSLLSSSVSKFTFISDETDASVDGMFLILDHASRAISRGAPCCIVSAHGDAGHFRAALRRMLGDTSARASVLTARDALPAAVAATATPSEAAARVIAAAREAADAAADAGAGGPAAAPRRLWIGVDDVTALAEAGARGLGWGFDFVSALCAESDVDVSVRAPPGVDWAVERGGGPLLSVSFRMGLGAAAAGVVRVQSLASGLARDVHGRVSWVPAGVESATASALFKVAFDGHAVGVAISN